MQITEKLIQNMGKIFEKGLQDDYLSRSLEKIIEHEKEKTAQEIKIYKDDLVQFESKYKIPSEDFFKRFEKGELGDSEDYFEWSSLFRMYKRAIERIEIFEEAVN